MRRILPAVAICLLLLAGMEFWLRGHLFKYVSYSNSVSIDQQQAALRTDDNWNVLFIGDSEVHWGIDPVRINSAFSTAGLSVRAFNHAFDGFGASWWPLLLPSLLDQPSLRRVRVVVLGVQLIDGHRIVRPQDHACGALQRPVLTSSYAIDLGMDDICRQETWDARLGRRLFSPLWVVRHASAVRRLVLPEFMSGTRMLALNSRSSGPGHDGFESHVSIAAESESYEREFSRWKAQYDPARDFQPLPPALWQGMTAADGFFDTIRQVVEANGAKLVLFALPTNPVVIDTFNRRADYLHNSRLLHAWASERGVIYIDLGIRDVVDPEIYFSDMRHLSGEGAMHYSMELGKAMARAFKERPNYLQSLSGSRP